MCHTSTLGDGAMKRAWAGWLVMGLLAAATVGCNPAVEKSKKPGGGAAGGVAEEIAAPVQSSATSEPATAVPAKSEPALPAASKPDAPNQGVAQPSAVSTVGATPKYLAGVPLIPRTALFGNPDKSSPRLSPDGKRLAYLAPVDGVMNVWVGPDRRSGGGQAGHPRQEARHSRYFWAYTNNHVLYVQDQDGDENWHVYAVNLADNTTKDLTPLANVAAQIEEVSDRVPDEILIGLNDRDRAVSRRLSRQHHDRRAQAG